MAKEKVPKLNLCIGSTSPNKQYDSGTARSLTNSDTIKRSDRNGNDSKSTHYLPRASENQENGETSGWEEKVLENSSQSPSRSPRASSLKETLKYTKSSKSDSSTTPRVVYAQNKAKNMPQFRSESARTR